MLIRGLVEVTKVLARRVVRRNHAHVVCKLEGLHDVGRGQQVEGLDLLRPLPLVLNADTERAGLFADFLLFVAVEGVLLQEGLPEILPHSEYVLGAGDVVVQQYHD